MNKIKIHKCIFTSEIVAEYKNKHFSKKSETGDPIMVPGSGITVWRHVCSECKSTYHSVSHWERSALGAGFANMGSGGNLTVRTPPRKPEEASKEKPRPPRKPTAEGERPERDRPRRRRGPQKNG